MLGGRFALRGCVLNYRTTLRDVEILLDDLRRVGRSFVILCAKPRCGQQMSVAAMAKIDNNRSHWSAHRSTQNEALRH